MARVLQMPDLGMKTAHPLTALVRLGKSAEVCLHTVINQQGRGEEREVSRQAVE